MGLPKITHFFKGHGDSRCSQELPTVLVGVSNDERPLTKLEHGIQVVQNASRKTPGIFKRSMLIQSQLKKESPDYVRTLVTNWHLGELGCVLQSEHPQMMTRHDKHIVLLKVETSPCDLFGFPLFQPGENPAAFVRRLAMLA